jgi:hypothetical protein
VKASSLYTLFMKFLFVLYAGVVRKRMGWSTASSNSSVNLGFTSSHLTSNWMQFIGWVKNEYPADPRGHGRIDHSS